MRGVEEPSDLFDETGDLVVERVALLDVDAWALGAGDDVAEDEDGRVFCEDSAVVGVAVGEEVETVESVAEPFLVRNGFMARTPRGRIATALGWSHIGRTPPAGIATLFDTPAPDA